MQLKGYSILEVIVSSIIILTTFLLFSILQGQLFGGTPISTEVKAVYMVNSMYVQDNEDVDIEKLRAYFPDKRIESSKEFINSVGADVYKRRVIVFDARNKAVLTIYQYCPTSNSKAFLGN